jgi:hypothetical protein
MCAGPVSLSATASSHLVPRVFLPFPSIVWATMASQASEKPPHTPVPHRYRRGCRSEICHVMWRRSAILNRNETAWLLTVWLHRCLHHGAAMQRQKRPNLNLSIKQQQPQISKDILSARDLFDSSLHRPLPHWMLYCSWYESVTSFDWWRL